MQNVTIIILIYLVSISSTCKRRIDCTQQVYSFSTTARAYQDRDSININDTIWVEFNEPTTFMDDQTGQNINFSNAANLGFGLTFDKFVGGSISNPGTIAAVSNFSTILIYGTELTSLLPDRIKSYGFLEETGRYKFKIGIVTKQKGVFSISISNAANVYRRNDGCPKAGFSITFANTNQHMYYYEQNRPGYTPSQYEQTHMYCFKVK